MHRIGIILIMEDGSTDADFEYVLSLCLNACDIKISSYDWKFAQINNGKELLFGREYYTESVPADMTYTRAVSKLRASLSSIKGGHGLITFALD